MRVRLKFEVSGLNCLELQRNAYLVLSKFLNVTSDEEVDSKADFEIESVLEGEVFKANVFARVKS